MRTDINRHWSMKLVNTWRMKDNFKDVYFEFLRKVIIVSEIIIVIGSTNIGSINISKMFNVTTLKTVDFLLQISMLVDE